MTRACSASDGSGSSRPARRDRRVSSSATPATVAAAGGLEGDRQRSGRRAITLRRYLAPQREALIKLQNESLFAAADTLLIREATDRLQRLLEDLDAAREHATLLQEEVFSVQNEAINDRMYLLAIISALFLPLGFLTGLFGINVGGLPGVEDPNAFWWFCSGVAVIALGVGVWMRKRRWL